MTTHMKKNFHTKKGISLVISLIMTTLLLSLSLSISNIVVRQIRLINASSNSQISFYAADTGLECALYWDTHSDGTVSNGVSLAYFGTATTYTPANNPIECGDGAAKPMNFQKQISGDTATSIFSIDLGKACSQVQVVKTPYRTKIYANGYNTGANASRTGCNFTDLMASRIVERGLVFSH